MRVQTCNIQILGFNKCNERIKKKIQCKNKLKAIVENEENNNREKEKLTNTYYDIIIPKL